MTRTLIKCGWIVSMDPAIGELSNADILIENDRIAAIGRNLDVGADETIDAVGMIAMPGLVNAHLHTFQTGFRAIGAEWAGGDYFKYLHGDMATRFTPEDNYLGNLVGALNQIDGGCTTLLDYCHNITSTEQAERSIDALEDSGIRAVFALGAGKFRPDREKLEPFEKRLNPRDRVEHFRKGRLASDDRLVTMALAVAGPHWAEMEPTRVNIRLAREFNLRSSTHATKRPHQAVDPRGYYPLLDEKLVGEDHTIVHGNYLSDDELKRLIDVGVTATATVQTELRGYAGHPLINRPRAFGILPALGVDVEPRVSGEMFREMHVALLYAQSVETHERARDGDDYRLPPIKSREALAWATIGGAKALGLDKDIGSLAPGKKADIVLLRADDINVFPVYDPLITIVEQAGPQNIDSVLINGVARKRAGKLLYSENTLRRRKVELQQSAERLMAEIGYVARTA